jgi:uncharacterized damage-inducible protein DinB
VSASTLLASLFKYKAWANGEILGKIKLIEPETQAAERQNAIRILNHTFVVDRIFAANLQRLKHEYTGTNTKDTPTLEQLDLSIKTSDAWYVDYVSKLTPESLSESIDFTFTDGAPGRMSREEMLSHVVLHGGYHRGAIGRIMTQLSMAPGRDVFTGFLHLSEPTDRRRVG